MKTTSNIEARLNQLFMRTFPYQLPGWFSKVIAEWTWLIVPAVIIVQPRPWFTRASTKYTS